MPPPFPWAELLSRVVPEIFTVVKDDSMPPPFWLAVLPTKVELLTDKAAPSVTFRPLTECPLLLKMPPPFPPVVLLLKVDRATETVPAVDPDAAGVPAGPIAGERGALDRHLAIKRRDAAAEATTARPAGRVTAERRVGEQERGGLEARDLWHR